LPVVDGQTQDPNGDRGGSCPEPGNVDCDACEEEDDDAGPPKFDERAEEVGSKGDPIGSGSSKDGSALAHQTPVAELKLLSLVVVVSRKQEFLGFVHDVIKVSQIPFAEVHLPDLDVARFAEAQGSP